MDITKEKSAITCRQVRMFEKQKASRPVILYTNLKAMNNKATKINDFTGHNIYVGIDAHLKSWAISIYSDEFELQKTF